MNIEDTITKKIKNNINPFYFKLVNFSEQHRHHETNNRTDYSHIKLIISSEIFEDKNKIKRERIIHKVLSEELRDRVHALVLKLYTVSEFESLGAQDL